MEKLGKFYFWGFLINAIILLGLGGYFFLTKNVSTETTYLFLFSGAIQMIIFFGLLFYIYNVKKKDSE